MNNSILFYDTQPYYCKNVQNEYIFENISCDDIGTTINVFIAIYDNTSPYEYLYLFGFYAGEPYLSSD